MNSANSEAAPPAGHRPSIAAVVVTYNRLALLQKCLAAVRGQTRSSDAIIVVNNGSTDGTTEWLAGQPDLTVVTQANSGSSGGQYSGIRTGYQNGHDWFWCMDDDTIPHPNSLERLVESRPFRDPLTGFLGSLVLSPEGILFGESFLLPTHTADWCQSVVTDHCVRVTVAPFVSLLVARHAVTAVGLPLKELFILYDDTEFCRRISARFRGYCVLDSTVTHESYPGAPPMRAKDFKTKHLYAIRNEAFYTRTSDAGRQGRWIALAELGYRTIRGILLRQKPVSAFKWYAAGVLLRARPDPAPLDATGPPIANREHADVR